jgi:hypothetical protein
MGGLEREERTMADFAGWIRGRTRGIGFAAAFVGAALLLGAGGTIPAAQAKTAKSELTLGPAGEGSGAEGRLQFKQKRRGERLKIRLDNLQPRTDYEVRDGATDDVLGTVRTDRRGRARKTLRAGPGESLSGVQLLICEPGSDEPILEGQVPGDDNGFTGSFKIGTVSTDPEASVQVSITLSSSPGFGDKGDPGVGTMDGMMNPVGRGLEGSYESISLFAGPGGVWIMDGGNDGGIPELPSIPGPVTFWIADGENGLVQVATIEKSDWGKPIPLPPAGMDGNSPMGYPDDGTGGGGGGDGWIYPQPDSYSWYADNLTEPGLPLGVTAAADLSGRTFEVRDGEGNVLLGGVLPALEEIVYEPSPEPMPLPDGTCPGGDFTININIDLSGIDWSSIDWNSIDFGSLPGSDGTCFDFTKLLAGYRF